MLGHKRSSWRGCEGVVLGCRDITGDSYPTVLAAELVSASNCQTLSTEQLCFVTRYHHSIREIVSLLGTGMTRTR